MTNGVLWSDERVAVLKAMHADKKTAREIADRLGGEISKSAVNGKIQRLGLSKPSERRAGEKPRRRKVLAETKLRVSLPPIFERDNWKPRTATVTPLNISLLDLEDGQCRYATTDASPHLFCGLVTQKDSSYCAEHHKICHSNPRNYTPITRERMAGRTRKNMFGSIQFPVSSLEAAE